MIRQDAILKISVMTVSAVSLLAFLVFYAPQRLETEFDDAYMFCRYASNFIAGNGFSWNPGDGPAYGVTSPAYLLLVSLVKWITGAENSTLLSLLSFSSGILAVFSMVITGLYYGKKTRKLGLSLLVVPLLLISPSFRYHSFTGMETMLSLASNSLLILVTLLFLRKQSAGRLFLLAATALLTVQVRPDNGFFAVIFPLLLLKSAGGVKFRKMLLFEIFLLIGLALLLFIWAKLLGSYLPISFYAKSGDFYRGYAGLGNWNHAEYLLRFLRDAAPFLTVAIILGGRKTLSVLPAILLPMALTFLYFSRTTQVMGWFARYYFPSLPFLVFLCFVALEERLKGNSPDFSRSLVYRSIILLALLIPTFSSPVRTYLEARWERKQFPELLVQQNLFETSSGILPGHIQWWNCIVYVSSYVDRLPSGIRIAATENGYIAAENPDAVVIDMTGLHDMEMARNGFSADRVLSRQPDVIWLPHSDYVLFREMIEENELFRESYDYFPGVFNYGIALRRDSPFYQACLDALSTVFEEAYPELSLEDFRSYPSS